MASLRTLTKQPGEALLFFFDFSAKMPNGGSLTSVVLMTATARGNVAGAGPITITSQSVSGSLAQALFSGGTDGETYLVLCRVTDSNGQTLEGEGLLKIVEN